MHSVTCRIFYTEAAQSLPNNGQFVRQNPPVSRRGGSLTDLIRPRGITHAAGTRVLTVGAVTSKIRYPGQSGMGQVGNASNEHNAHLWCFNLEAGTGGGGGGGGGGIQGFGWSCGYCRHPMFAGQGRVEWGGGWGGGGEGRDGFRDLGGVAGTPATRCLLPQAG